MINSTEKIISHKVGLLNLAEELQNVSPEYTRIKKRTIGGSESNSNFSPCFQSLHLNALRKILVSSGFRFSL